MINKRQIESSQKQFGELFTVQVPESNLPDEKSFDSDDYSSDIRFDLRPEFPSHVPTPETINLGINYHIKTMFDGDDGQPKKSTRRQRNRKKNAKSMKALGLPTQTISTPTPKMKILIASTFSTKWGSDVWNSIKINGVSSQSSTTRLSSSSNFINSDGSIHSDRTDDTSLASDKTPQQEQPNRRKGPLRRNRAKGPTTSPRPVGKSLSADTKSISNCPTYDKLPLAPSKAREKWIVSGERLERMEPLANKKTNNATSTRTSCASSSSLQRKWMLENALNLHAMCQRNDNEEHTSSRRSSFLPRLRRKSSDV